MNTASLSLSLTRKTRAVLLEDVAHTLTELTGKQRDEYITFTASRMKNGPDGKPIGVRDYAGFQSRLVHLSLTKNDDGTRYTEEVINTWPAAAVSAIFDAAQELSGLGKEEKATEAEIKNG